MAVLGLDSCKTGWIAVVIDKDGYVHTFVALAILEAELIGRERWGVSTIVVDIPIGIPDTGRRAADTEARAFITPRHSSVFSTPVRAALQAESYEAARIASIAATGGTSLSKQAWAIGPMILDVDAHMARASARILEGHPEVSFRAMAGAPIDYYKKDLEGATLRRQLLINAGIDIPLSVARESRGVASDDVFDAGAMAWTARRVERGEAISMPATPEVFSDGRESAIWY